MMVRKPMRRVYYFTPPTHALENLENQKLKVSRFSKCNDAYELAAFDLGDRNLRRKLNDWLSWQDEISGLLCFCRSWRSPVLWGHYAQNHTGLCYGFDVDPEVFVDVKYVSERLFPDMNLSSFEANVGEDQMTDLFATKFIHWAYEEEVRLLVKFSAPVVHNKNLFFDFSDQMKLREVIVGPRSDIRVGEIMKYVSNSEVEVFKSRLAFKTFSVVRQRDKSKW